MLEVYKEQILKILKRRDYKGLKKSQIGKAIGVESDDWQEFNAAFDEMRTDGWLVLSPRNIVSLPSMTSKIIGTFRANPKGFGFVLPREANIAGNLFIPADDTAGAMTGDIVEARVLKKGKRQGQMRYTGKVTEILERSANQFVGTLLKEGKQWYVQPDGNVFTERVSIEDVTAKGAKLKDKVVVEILTYPSEQYLASGVILEVLGRAGQYASETASVIRQFHLPAEFSNECVEQARKAAADFNADGDANREDITGKVVITIDPPDAKDFDDAISIEKDENGNWLLGVHIADVSSFVTEGSPLDVEAKERGNSIYLPQKVIPMLPEILSNGICSLQPKQKRFCKSAYITYDNAGRVVARRYANSVMWSAARLTYQQADQILKGHTKDFDEPVIELLKNMEKLARIIEKRRVENGMLHLALPETELIFDEAGMVVDAEPADDSYPHTIIEMFMVEANDSVAVLIDRLKIPFLRRIHPDPNGLAMKELAKLIKTLGLSMPRNPDRAAIQELLHGVKGKDMELAVNMFVLRSMEKAVYSPLDMGHYALASRHYSHFTSPIRRYADLLLHRILDAHLRGQEKDATDKTKLTEVGKHISFTEQRAEDAERELKTVLLLQMLSKRLGDEIDGVITGVAGFGIFVRCQKFGIEGLIQLEDIGPDKWKFKRKSHCIIGMNSGCLIQIGQRMKARIVSVNIPARQLDLMPVEPLGEPKQQRHTKTKKKYPRKRHGDRR